MPQDGYTSVTVPNEDYERAKEYKPSDMSWGGVLVAGAEHLNENLDSDPRGYQDRPEINLEQLENIESSVTNVENRIGKLERMLEQMSGRP